MNKSIIKQSIKSNWVLWTIITLIMVVILCVIVGVYNPSITNTLTDQFADMIPEDMMGQIGALSSILGSLGETFYAMIAVIAIMVYIIVTANNLVASEVDKGSMAYTLSTPIKRKTVILSKATYFVGSLFAMMLITTLVGLVTIQLRTGLVFGNNYTDDIKEISKETGKDKEELKKNLWFIIENEEALSVGAEARKVDKDIYKTYLNARIKYDVYEEIGEELGLTSKEVSKKVRVILEDEALLKKVATKLKKTENELKNELIVTDAVQNESETKKLMEQSYPAVASALGVTVAEVKANPALILMDQTYQGLAAGAQAVNLTVEVYGLKLQGLIQISFEKQVEEIMLNVLTTAAEVLDTKVASLSNSMYKIKESEVALNAAINADGVSELAQMANMTPTALINQIIDGAVANMMVSDDFSENYSNWKFILMNLGLFILAFAISSISFFASCLFNLSKHSFALGAGVPLVFWVLALLSKINENLSVLKYFTLNTLYDTSLIINGGNYIWNFVALISIGVLFYGAGIYVFKKKDLPL